MAQHENCKKYVDCTWRNDVGYCLDYCNQFKHKDEVIVIRCADCKHWKAAGRNEPSGWCCAWDCGRMQNGYCEYGEMKTKIEERKRNQWK